MTEAKLDITDELLVAYVDDELDPPQRELVSSILAANPMLSRRAEEMRLSRDLLREAFPLHPDTSVPEPIDTAANRLAEACARRIPSTQKRPSLRGWTRYVAAAAFVLCVAGAATYLTWRATNPANNSPVTALTRINPASALHAVLESEPSAEMIDIPAEDAAVRAVLTFRTQDGRFCREFEILAGSRGSTGVACRTQGEWHTEVVLSSAVTPVNSNYYTPAGDADESAVAEVVNRLIRGDPLSAQEEARVLASGWQVSEAP